MLEMRTALTADIGILEAGVTALLGYAVVFFGLILLMCVVMGLGKVMTAKAQKPAPAVEVKPAAQPVAEVKKEEAKGTAGTILLDFNAAQCYRLIFDGTAAMEPVIANMIME